MPYKDKKKDAEMSKLRMRKMRARRKAEKEKLDQVVACCDALKAPESA